MIDKIIGAINEILGGEDNKDSGKPTPATGSSTGDPLPKGFEAQADEKSDPSHDLKAGLDDLTDRAKKLGDHPQ